MIAPLLYDDLRLILKPVDHIATPSLVHQSLLFSFASQPRAGTGFLTSATHWCSVKQSKARKEQLWVELDKLYNLLEHLRVLNINLQSQGPWPETLRNAWVEKISGFLRSLRARTNFSLTFTIEKNTIQVSQIVTSVPRLPIGLQVQVLGHLRIESNRWEPQARMQALASCCLVCRNWYDICHRELFGAASISLRTLRQLGGLVAAMSSATANPLGRSIVTLSFTSIAGIDPVYRVAPLYLATKLPSLQHVFIDGGDRPDTDHPHFLSLIRRTPTQRTFHGHTSLIVHLKYFTTVTRLRLSHMTFQSFWDFRRFVVALPALSHLRLDWIDLPDADPFRRPHGRVPSLFSAPRNLISIHATSLTWNPLWIWVMLHPAKPQQSRNPGVHPCLTPGDAETIYNLAFGLKFHDDKLNGIFSWSYNEGLQSCESVAQSTEENVVTLNLSRGFRLLATTRTSVYPSHRISFICPRFRDISASFISVTSLADQEQAHSTQGCPRCRSSI